MEIPVDHPGQEQKSQWLQIRQQRPDYVLMWGWGVMNQVAIQEAANIRFPMENFIGVWWSGSENDVIPVGDGADGYKSLNMHMPGMDFPIYDELKTYLYDKGLAAGAGDQAGTVLYNRGMYNAMIIAEAIRKAQELSGATAITPAQLRDGMEQLVITQDRLTELGIPNFGPAVEASCENHGGQGMAIVQQWDAAAKKWNVLTDYIQSDSEVIDALIAEDSAAYAAEAGITERCN